MAHHRQWATTLGTALHHQATAGADTVDMAHPLHLQADMAVPHHDEAMVHQMTTVMAVDTAAVEAEEGMGTEDLHRLASHMDQRATTGEGEQVHLAAWVEAGVISAPRLDLDVTATAPAHLRAAARA